MKLTELKRLHIDIHAWDNGFINLLQSELWNLFKSNDKLNYIGLTLFPLTRKINVGDMIETIIQILIDLFDQNVQERLIENKIKCTKN